MSLEQIYVPFPKYFIDKIKEELKLDFKREVDISEIYGYIFLLATSGYLTSKVMK